MFCNFTNTTLLSQALHPWYIWEQMYMELARINPCCPKHMVPGCLPTHTVGLHQRSRCCTIMCINFKSATPIGARQRPSPGEKHQQCYTTFIWTVTSHFRVQQNNKQTLAKCCYSITWQNIKRVLLDTFYGGLHPTYLKSRFITNR